MWPAITTQAIAKGWAIGSQSASGLWLNPPEVRIRMYPEPSDSSKTLIESVGIFGIAQCRSENEPERWEEAR